MMKSWVFSLLSFLFIASGLNAQNGTVFGRISDLETHKPIEAATVKLEGTVNFGGFTDSDGNFVIQAAPGTYVLIVRLVEYKELRVENIVVGPGSKVEANHTLEGLSVTTGPIVIHAKTSKTSTGAVLEFRREGMGMNVGISGGDIARSPDRNTSQVLRRISGASIQENRFVIIRGLSDRYNTAQLNGMALPSTEPDRKAFSFDIFPSAMLDNLVIQKTATPDLPGAFAGGVIQLNTKDVPEKKFFSFSASTNYNTQSTFKPFQTYAGGKTDWMGRDDGTRGIPTSVPGSDEFKALLTDPTTRYTASAQFVNDWKVIGRNSAAPGLNLQANFGSSKTIGRSQIGFIAGGIYQYNRRLVVSERGDFNIDTTRLFRFTDNQYREDVNLGGLVNLTFSHDSGAQKVSFKSIWNQIGEDIFVERSGIDYNIQQEIQATSMQYTGTKLLTHQLSGQHKLTKSGVELKWGGSMSDITRSVPDLRRMYYVRNFGDTDFQAYVPPGAPSPNYAGKYFGSLNENLIGGDLSLAVPFKIDSVEQKIQAGFSTQIRDRNFAARVFGYVIGNTATFDWTRLYEGQDTIFDAASIGPDGFRLAEGTNPSDSYEANSHLYAAYILSDNHLLKKLRLVWGVRAEQYQQALNSQNYGGDTISLDTTVTDLLPSFNLNYTLKENMFLRLAASRTVCRPEFRELAPFSFYDFNTSSSVYGNDTLVRSHIMNFDARWEVYPTAGQFISATVFYKQFNNPIEQVVDASSGAGSRIFTFQNVIGARSLGFELELRVKANPLDSIVRWKGWDRLTWFANFSYINSRVDLSNIPGQTAERPLQGQSPYLINTGLMYFDVVRGFSVSTLVNRIGRRIFQVGNNGYLDIYEAPRTVIDLQLGMRILKNAEVKMNFSDLLNQQSVFYQDQDASGKFEEETDTKFTGTRFGSNASLGFSLNF